MVGHQWLTLRRQPVHHGFPDQLSVVVLMGLEKGHTVKVLFIL
jgi:hypothetical protein